MACLAVQQRDGALLASIGRFGCGVSYSIILGTAARCYVSFFSMIYDIEKAFRGVFGGDRALGRLDVASVGAGACALGAVVHNFGVAIGRWPVARWPLVTDH